MWICGSESEMLRMPNDGRQTEIKEVTRRYPLWTSLCVIKVITCGCTRGGNSRVKKGKRNVFLRPQEGSLKDLGKLINSQRTELNWAECDKVDVNNDMVYWQNGFPSYPRRISKSPFDISNPPRSTPTFGRSGKVVTFCTVTSRTKLGWRWRPPHVEMNGRESERRKRKSVK